MSFVSIYLVKPHRMLEYPATHDSNIPEFQPCNWGEAPNLLRVLQSEILSNDGIIRHDVSHGVGMHHAALFQNISALADPAAEF